MFSVFAKSMLRRFPLQLTLTLTPTKSICLMKNQAIKLKYFNGLRFKSFFSGNNNLSNVTGEGFSKRNVYLSGGLMTACVIGLYFKARHDKQIYIYNRELSSTIGEAVIGGPFELINSETEKLITEKDFSGQWLLMYFGFTHCPDVCPEELNKIADAMEIIDSRRRTRNKVQPVVVCVDYKRDTPEVVRNYVKEFHPKFLGLCGNEEQISKMCKSWRIYFSPGLFSDIDTDYLVDHSIITYLIDPEGHFSQFFGQTKTAKDIADEVSRIMGLWIPEAQRPKEREFSSKKLMKPQL